jgi:hypothetical protein
MVNWFNWRNMEVPVRKTTFSDLPAIGADDRDLAPLYRIVFWVIAFLSSILQVWRSRFVIWGDGVSYLDMGDAYFRHDWKMAINGVWSPLYSWLIVLPRHFFNLPIKWEATQVHYVNLVIFVLVLCSLEYFLNALVRGRVSRELGQESMRIPAWAIRTTGYALFLLSSVTWLSVEATTPDLCVEGIIFLIAGTIVLIRTGDTSWIRFLALGLFLGIGYLAKAALFPLALPFLAVSFFGAGASRRAFSRVVFSGLIFLAVASPLAISISKADGRLTYSDSGWLNYLWCVNIPAPFGDSPVSDSRASVSGLKDDQRFGTAKHPVMQLLAEPPLNAFPGPINATYPFWYNPAYWYEGMTPRFQFFRQLKVIKSNLYILFDDVVSVQYDVIVGFLALCLLAPSRRLLMRSMLSQAHLWIPAAIPIAAYVAIQVQQRYLPGFLLVIWMSLFSGLIFPRLQSSNKLVWCITLALVMTVSARVLRMAVSDVTHIVRGSADPYENVVESLRGMGIHPGDRVASIGYTFDAYWARRAGATIVAEIPIAGEDAFWSATPETRARVYQTFAKTGARVIVCNRAPHGISVAGWQRLGSSNYMLYNLMENTR